MASSIKRSINTLFHTNRHSREIEGLSGSREGLETHTFRTKGLDLLDGQQSDGSFGVHPYQKWTGAHWRLVSLVELGITSGSGAAVRATNLVLEWLLGEAHLRNIPKINGRYRRCASQEGNALAVCSRLGLAEDPRVLKLAESLVSWQWSDG